MSLRAHPETGRNDSAHGDEDGIDPAPYMDEALEAVIETIMLFAQYPQPKRGISPTRRIEFDLYDYVQEKYDNAELVEIAVQFLTEWGSNLNELHEREVAKLAKMLTAELAGGEIVRDKAEQLAIEERS